MHGTRDKEIEMPASQSVTIKNLEAAFAGESMAHIKYMWFARLCRAAGDEATAKVFEDTAAQEVQHAFGHAELLFAGQILTPARCLEYAIEGETHEYTEMYPRFRHEAVQEGHDAAVAEIDEQIAESKQHAGMFKAVLDKAAKRFAALAKVEEKHANHYRSQLNTIAA
jgi:rubrerythrin